MTVAALRSPCHRPVDRRWDIRSFDPQNVRPFDPQDVGPLDAQDLRPSDPQDAWSFDAQDLAALRTRARIAAPGEQPLASRAPLLAGRRADAAAHRPADRSRIGSAPRTTERSGAAAPLLPLAGAAGLGLVGVALMGAVPAQAAAIEFPAWVSVTGTVPDDAGLDRQAAQANDWTFSWSTDADGVVTFDYADGTRSTSLDPVARPAAPTGTAAAPEAGDLSVQSLHDPLWEADPARAAADPGLDELAAAVASPFEQTPSAQGAGEEVAAPSQAGPASETAGPAPEAAGGVSDQQILDTAAQGLGGQYVWGGTGFKAWDCSAFVQWVYAQHGIEIPRVTWEQFAAAQPTTDPRPGDLVSQNGGSHVGIYLGGDRMISALNPQQGTIEHSLHDMPLDGFYTVR